MATQRKQLGLSWMENLEDRRMLSAPPPAVAAPLDARSIVVCPQDGPTNIRVIDPASGQVIQSYFAFDPGYLGGARVAKADVTGDGVPDVIVGSSLGASHVKVFDGVNAAEIRSFLAFPGVGGDPADPTSDFYRLQFTGGVYVAAGDVDADGRADVIVSADAGGTPHVKVYSGATGDLIQSFFAYDAGFAGGVRIASGDINGDGHFDIITAAGSAAPHVAVFNGIDDSVMASFYAFDPGFQFGVFVGTGDFNDDGKDEIITSTSLGPPHVKAWDMTNPSNPTIYGNGAASFFAYPTDFLGGVHVASTDYDGDHVDDLITSTGPGLATIKVFNHGTFAEIASLTPFENYTGGLWIAGGDVGH